MKKQKFGKKLKNMNHEELWHRLDGGLINNRKHSLNQKDINLDIYVKL